MIFKCDFISNQEFVSIACQEIGAVEIDVEGIPARRFRGQVYGYNVKFEVGFSGPLVVRVACQEPARTVFIIWMVQLFRDMPCTGIAMTTANATKIVIRPGEAIAIPVG
jgi:hypothetical protein